MARKAPAGPSQSPSGIEAHTVPFGAARLKSRQCSHKKCTVRPVIPHALRHGGSATPANQATSVMSGLRRGGAQSCACDQKRQVIISRRVPVAARRAPPQAARDVRCRSWEPSNAAGELTQDEAALDLIRIKARPPFLRSNGNYRRGLRVLRHGTNDGHPGHEYPCG